MNLCICDTISLIGSDPAAITEETLIVSLYAYVVHMIVCMRSTYDLLINSKHSNIMQLYIYISV